MIAETLKNLAHIRAGRSTAEAGLVLQIADEMKISYTKYVAEGEAVNVEKRPGFYQNYRIPVYYTFDDGSQIVAHIFKLTDVAN